MVQAPVREILFVASSLNHCERVIISGYLFTRLICCHDRLHVLGGKSKLVTEEQGADKRKLLKLLQSDGLLEKLPLRLKREEFVDELFRIRQEIMVIIFVSKKC